MTAHIEYWHDETSSPDEPTYCVSLCEEDGDEIKCLSTHENESEAASAAQEAAEKRGIECFFRATNGQLS